MKETPNKPPRRGGGTQRHPDVTKVTSGCSRRDPDVTKVTSGSSHRHPDAQKVASECPRQGQNPNKPPKPQLCAARVTYLIANDDRHEHCNMGRAPNMMKAGQKATQYAAKLSLRTNKETFTQSCDLQLGRHLPIHDSHECCHHSGDPHTRHSKKCT